MAPTYFALRPSSGSLQLSLAKVTLILTLRRLTSTIVDVPHR